MHLSFLSNVLFWRGINNIPPPFISLAAGRQEGGRGLLFKGGESLEIDKRGPRGNFWYLGLAPCVGSPIAPREMVPWAREVSRQRHTRCKTPRWGLAGLWGANQGLICEMKDLLFLGVIPSLKQERNVINYTSWDDIKSAGNFQFPAWLPHFLIIQIFPWNTHITPLLSMYQGYTPMDNFILPIHISFADAHQHAKI